MLGSVIKGAADQKQNYKDGRIFSEISCFRLAFIVDKPVMAGYNEPYISIANGGCYRRIV